MCKSCPNLNFMDISKPILARENNYNLPQKYPVVFMLIYIDTMYRMMITLDPKY